MLSNLCFIYNFLQCVRSTNSVKYKLMDYIFYFYFFKTLPSIWCFSEEPWYCELFFIFVIIWEWGAHFFCWVFWLVLRPFIFYKSQTLKVIRTSQDWPSYVRLKRSARVLTQASKRYEYIYILYRNLLCSSRATRVTF